MVQAQDGPRRESHLRFSFFVQDSNLRYLLRSIRLHQLRRPQTTKSMGLFETRVVEGMPEKISSPRWLLKIYSFDCWLITCYCLYFSLFTVVCYYIVDYYIYKALKVFEKEGKILVILCENRIFYQFSLSIGVLAKNIRISELQIMGI